MQKKKISRFLSLFLTVALVISLMPSALAADVTSVTLNKGTLNLTVGETETLTATVSPTGAGDVTWSTDTPGVATVKDGTVTAVGEGKAEITATSGNQTATCRVTVSEESTAVTGITVKPGRVTLSKDDDITLTPEITPSSATNKTVKWSSNNTHVATVSDSGKVTAVGTGTANITATTEDGKKQATCVVEVVAETTISLNKTSLNLYTGGSETLVPIITPSTAPDKAVTWSSSNNHVTVGTDGKVTANSVGDATVTATLGNGNSASCQVTVSTPVPTLDTTSFSLDLNKERKLTMNHVPSGATVTWAITSGSSYISMIKYDNTSCTVKGIGTGTGTVTATISGSNTKYNCTIKVGSTTKTPDTITYKTSKGKAVEFKVNDFKDVCSAVTGYSLDYVTFSSVSSSSGALYYDYTSSNNYDHEVTSTSKKYYSNSNPYLKYISFVPNSSKTGTVNLTYTAVNTKGTSFSGKVAINISGSSGDVTYKVAKNGQVDFSVSDFNTYCKEETGATLDYVTFSSVSSSKGTLYYKYGTSSEKEAGTSKYYRSSKSPYLEDITFVPKSGTDGIVEINFTGYSIDDDKFSGTVEITVGSGSSGNVTYSVPKNGKVDFSNSEFNTYCKDKTGDNFKYITFSSVKSSDGKLYYKYDTSSQKEAGSSKYYRTSSSSSLLSDLTFVPASGNTGTVKIGFDGMSEDNDDFSGTVVITIGSNGTTVKGDVTYTSPANSPVSLSVTDFNDYCKKETNKTYNLDYVTFTGSVDSNQGALYYKYGESGQKSVTTTAKYYRSGTASLLKDVSFVPKNGFAGTVQIKFTGYNTNGDSFTGTLGILFESLSDPTKITYTTGAKAIPFVNSDFVSACAKRGGDALKSVKFTLPDESAGTLYYNYISPTSFGGKVNSSTVYTNGTGTGTIGSVSFVPKAGYNGIATITYTGTDSGGTSFTGYVYITVTPSTNSSKFNDMKNHTWAAASVDFLSDYKVVTGTTSSTYNPGGSITRGDFILMLYRAFGFSSSSTSNFKDVPADSYYAEAIAAAKALGIAQGTNNRFEPQASLTREDAMVLIQRTMEKTNRTLPSGSTATLDRFADSGKISSYAKTAVAALVQASIVKGDDNGNFNPKNTISRAEMAVALHRVLTL